MGDNFFSWKLAERHDVHFVDAVIEKMRKTPTHANIYYVNLFWTLINLFGFKLSSQTRDAFNHVEL